MANQTQQPAQQDNAAPKADEQQQATSPVFAITAETLANALHGAAHRPPVERIAGMDEAGEGHHFVTADGRKVDSEGKPIK